MGLFLICWCKIAICWHSLRVLGDGAAAGSGRSADAGRCCPLLVRVCNDDVLTKRSDVQKNAKIMRLDLDESRLPVGNS